MAYITNEGSRLIERAKTEGKSIVFGSVRMNTTYKSDPASLVQQSEEWFGENHGSVVGCLSHVSVDEASEACDSKLAVQCYDNSKAWKSIGIYAHLDGEEGEELFACESIQNGGYEDVTIVEIPVTLDGVVADFGLSEGDSGSGGGGGGGVVPANMMTTDTEQTGLTGGKTWEWTRYEGGGTMDAPQDGDRRTKESISIVRDDGTYTPLIIERTQSTFRAKESFWEIGDAESLQITASEVRTISSFAEWSSIINAARLEQGFDYASVSQMEDGSFEINGVPVIPNKEIIIGDHVLFVIDSNSKIASVRANSSALDVSAAVIEGSTAHRVSGIVVNDAVLSFDSPITLARGQQIYVHWTRYDNNNI